MVRRQISALKIACSNRAMLVFLPPPHSGVWRYSPPRGRLLFWTSKNENSAHLAKRDPNGEDQKVWHVVPKRRARTNKSAITTLPRYLTYHGAFGHSNPQGRLKRICSFRPSAVVSRAFLFVCEFWLLRSDRASRHRAGTQGKGSRCGERNTGIMLLNAVFSGFPSLVYTVSSDRYPCHRCVYRIDVMTMLRSDICNHYMLPPASQLRLVLSATNVLQSRHPLLFVRPTKLMSAIFDLHTV